MNKQIHLVLVATALVLGISAAAQATIISTGVFANTEAAFPASSSDLVQGGAPSLVSVSCDRSSFLFGTLSDINDGHIHNRSLGDPDNGMYLPATAFGGALPTTYTFNLNTSVNTLGYDITKLDSFAGWAENSLTLANQKIEVKVHSIGGSGYSSLGTFVYKPFSVGPVGASATSLSITDDSGTGSVFASGVDSIQVTYVDTGDRPGVDGLVVHEIDVTGSPTVAVPEPSTVALLITGLLGLVCVWRKRK